MNFDDQIIEAIRSDFELDYKTGKESKRHISGLKCPGCKRNTLFIGLDKPHRLACSHIGSSCGYTEATMKRYKHLWENLEDKFPTTHEDPNATAKAYMSMRGFDLIKTERWFEQGQVRLDDGTYGPTVRFKLWDGFWWDRLINLRDIQKFTKQRGKPIKADFKVGIEYRGKHWMPEGMTINDGDHVYIVEGIFHAIAFYLAGYKAVAAFSTSSVPRELINANLNRNITWSLAYDAGMAGESANLKYLKEINDLKEASRICLPHSADADWDDLYREGKLTDEYLEDCKWRGRILAGDTVKKKAFALYCWKPYTHTVMNAFKQTYGIEVSTDGITKMLLEETMDFYKHGDIFDLNVEVNQILNCELVYHHAEVDKFTQERKYVFTAYTKTLPKGENLELSAANLSKRENLSLALLNKMTWLEFTGSQGDFTWLKRRWSRSSDLTVETIPFIGFDETNRAYVFPNVGYQEGKCYPVNSHGYIAFNDCGLKTTLKNVNFLHSKKFDKKILPDFIKIFYLNGLAALGYWTASLFTRQIKEVHQSFPFLELTGEKEAGKTTLIRFLWKMFGRENYEGIDILTTSESSRGRTLSQLSNLPVVLVESDREADLSKGRGGRPSKSVDWDDFKKIFDLDGVLMSRGVKTNDNQVNESIFRGALVITQNESVNSSDATMSRIVHLHCTTAHKKIENRAIADRLKKMSVEDLAGYLHLALTNEKQYLAKFFTAFDYHRLNLTKFTNIKSQRIIDNHAQLMAACDALTVLFDNLEKPVLDQVFGHLVGRAKERENRLKADHPLVLKFWETYYHINDQVMTLIDEKGNEDEIPNEKLNHSANKQHIAVNLNDFYEQCRKRNQETFSIDDLKKLLPTSSNPRFIKEKPVMSRITKKQSRCFVFEKPAETVSN